MHFIILKQLLVLFSFVVFGYILCKSKSANSESASLISSIQVNIVIPCLLIKTYTEQFTVDNLIHNFKIIITALVLLLFTVLLSKLIAHFLCKEKDDKGIYTYSMAVPNYGYMGYPLAEAAGGQAMLMNAMVFAVPLSIYSTTAGFNMLMNNKNSTLKKVINPITIATLIGCIFGLNNVEIPSGLMNILEMSSNCLVPLSMILMGMVISEFNFKEILRDKKIYITAVIRLLVIPIIIYLSLKNICDSTILKTAVLIYAMPCGLNTIVIPKLRGGNCKIGAGLAVISNILSLITLPLILSL